jgi:hypothetical protein
MSFEQSGRITHIGQTEEVGQSGFQKRALVISETNERGYMNEYAFEAVKDKVSMMDPLQVGQDVTVHFNVRCREYNGRWYTDLTAWRIQAEQTAPPAAPPQAPPPPPGPAPVEPQQDDQIPF